MIIAINSYNIIDDENMSDIEHFFDEKIADYNHIACNIIIENLHEYELFESMIKIDGNMII